ncbi:MAG TPA: peptidylprolyl isomerase [Planctomycetota bacterium]|nr:peptidylprolyl isomerase [Planctomycetota bacterium]HRU50584.1 peptidylprolyl isomerase [Planctomycetota bacterium]
MSNFVFRCIFCIFFICIAIDNQEIEKSNKKIGVPAASFADEIITKEELYDLMLKRFPNQVQAVLSEIALHRMIELECKEKNIDIPRSMIITEAKEELTKLKAEIQEKLGLEWKSYLSHNKIRERDVQKDLWLKAKYSLAIYALVRLQESEMDLIDARHILVSSREKAESIRQKLLNHADFGTLAKQESISHTGQNGGKISKIARGDLKDENLELAVFSLPVHEISNVIESKYGFHIWQVLKIYPARDKVSWKAISKDIWKLWKKNPVLERDFQLWFQKVEKKYPLQRIY